MSFRSQAAFTLIELLFTVAIAAILSMIAAPSFKRALVHNRVIQTDNQLIGALNYARSQAVTHGVAAILCPSDDGSRCTSSQNWQGGWLVAHDADHDFQPDAAPQRIFADFPTDIRVHSSRGRLHVRYQPDGSSPGSNLSLIVCQAGEPDTARSVVVSNAGRIRQGTASPAQAKACSG